MIKRKDKILITGVGGNVGQYVGEKLWKAGYEVVGIYRYSVPQEAKYKLVQADLSKEKLTLSNIDVVIHIAAAVEGDTKRIIQDNIKATENLLCFAEDAGVKRIIYISTVSVYGSVKGELREGSDKINVGVYGMSKCLCENLIRESNIPEILIIQLPRMLGPFVDLDDVKGSGFLSLTKKLLFGENVVCYNPEARYNNYLHVADLETFLEKMLEAGNLGRRTILVAAKEQLKMKDILSIMRREVKSSSKIIIKEENVVPRCSVINIGEAEKLGFSPSEAEKMLKRFMCEISIGYKKQENKMKML